MVEKKKGGFDWDNITAGIKKENGKKDFADARFWKLTPDEKGEAMAIIRFLPTNKGDHPITAKYYTHSFKYQNNGEKWYVDNCVSTFGFDRECPVCAKNQEYWNSAFDKDKKIASERKRKLFYIANIQVIKNPNKPEEEGKFFLYKFGSKIREKIDAKWFPSDTDLQDPDFKQFIPFNPMTGANFKLKGTNLHTKKNKPGVFPNYDTSEFSPQSEYLGGDAKKIEAALENTLSLNEFVDETKYPKNEEVSKKLACILGGVPSSVSDDDKDDTPPFDMGDDDIPDFTPPSESGSDGEEDPDEAFFNDLTK